jgi:hypothetical protein
MDLFGILIFGLFFFGFIKLFSFGLKACSKEWGHVAEKYGTDIKPRKYDFKSSSIRVVTPAEMGRSSVSGLVKYAFLEVGLFIGMGFPFNVHGFKKPLLVPWSEVYIKDIPFPPISIKGYDYEFYTTPAVINTLSEYMKYNVREENV